MLLSPVLCHHALSLLVSADDGPHTALLASPHGQVVASARRKYDEEDGDAQGTEPQPDEGDDGQPDGVEQGGSSTPNRARENDTAAASRADGAVNGGLDEEGDGEGEEPWLDEPERTRLLLGLASQWSAEESPRIECELGRLYIRLVPLPAPESLSANSGVPPVRNPYIPNFLLVLNGSVDTPWNTLADLAESFEL